MFLTGSLSFIYIVFTCFLQAPFFHLHVSYRPPFFIYMVFTYFLQAPFFHLHGFYMFLTGPLFSFTWFLHVSYRPPFFIYMVFTSFLQAPFFHLHGFYRVTNITFPDFLQHSLELFTCFLHGLAKQFTCFFTKADTVKVRKIFYRFLHVLQMVIVDKDNVNHYLQNIYMLY